MAITFRHDAAAVALPSVNAAGRKYGQDLVLQQQQQKYQGYQAGLNRLADAVNQRNQNLFQLNRDQLQAKADKKARKFDFKLEQRQAEADRQRQFMDEARKQSSAIIMDDIQNGAYDPATARKLRQNLVAESEVLGNPNLDATQRAEALGKIRAARAMLTANRMEPEPEPTDQAKIDSGTVIVNGVAGQLDKDGIFRPFPKEELPPQEPSRPASVDAAIAADRSDYDAILKDEISAITEGDTLPLTQERLDQARERARKQYEKELGLGTPTPAPPQPGGGPAQQPGSTQPVSILEPDPMEGFKGNEVPGQPGSYYTRPPGQPVPPDPMLANQEQPPPLPGYGPTGQPPQGAQPNEWSEVAGGSTLPLSSAASSQNQMGMPASQGAAKPDMQAAPAQQSAVKPDVQAAGQSVPSKQGMTQEDRKKANMELIKKSGLPESPRPNFNKLVEEADDDSDRSLIRQVRVLAGQGYSPDVNNALYVVVNPVASKEERKKANAFLLSNGINLSEVVGMGASTEEVLDSGRMKMANKYGSSYDSF